MGSVSAKITCVIHIHGMIYKAPHNGNISSEVDVTLSRATNKSLSTTSTYKSGNEGVDNYTSTDGMVNGDSVSMPDGLTSYAPTNLMTHSILAAAGDVTTESSSKNDAEGHSVVWVLCLLFDILVYFLI